MRKSWNRMIALALALAFILALAPQPGAWETAYAVGSYGRVLKNGTFVRKQPGSDSYWFKLDTGFICTVTDTTSEGGYTWYNIRTSSGLVGFVRGDCASASIGGGSGSGSGGSSGVVSGSDKTFVRLPSNTLLFTTETMPSSGGITVAAGTVLLAGTEEDVIYGHAARLLTDPAAYRAMAQAVNPYGDGQACRRIADAVLWHFQWGERPADYQG